MSTSHTENSSLDCNTLREILEYVRLEIEDGHGIDLTHAESVLFMAEFDRLAAREVSPDEENSHG